MPRISRASDYVLRALVTNLLTIACVSVAVAQTAPPVNLPDSFRQLNADDIAQGAIALVNFSAAPGISGATFKVDDPELPSAELVRTSLGFQTDVTLRDFVFDGFVAGSLGGATTDEEFVTDNAAGEEIRFEADRSILSARFSGGLSFPITRYFRIQTYASVIAARFETESTITGNVDLGSLPDEFEVIVTDNEFDAAGIGGTVEASYDRWFDEKRLELGGTYTAAYTETFNVSDDLLQVEGTSHTVVLRARYSGPTGWITNHRPWRWNVYSTYTDFVDQPKTALGFTYYVTVGAGVMYEWNLKPLNWFGLRFVGLQGGVIVGDDVDGWTLGISFQ